MVRIASERASGNRGSPHIRSPRQVPDPQRRHSRRQSPLHPKAGLAVHLFLQIDPYAATSASSSVLPSPPPEFGHDVGQQNLAAQRR